MREYNAQNMSLDELADKIAGHGFKDRKKEGTPPTMARALDYKDANYESGTFDEVYRAQAFGLLTKKDMQTILDRVDQSQSSSPGPDRECRSASSPEDAEVIELQSAPEPYLLKVGDGYVRIKVTSE
ncbi:MAG TPA: hypothetical protein VHI31_02865 [Actinomycetota bacterium]|nr:hypothetical protein [Actinomycetota bacterium]